MPLDPTGQIAPALPILRSELNFSAGVRIDFAVQQDFFKLRRGPNHVGILLVLLSLFSHKPPSLQGPIIVVESMSYRTVVSGPSAKAGNPVQRRLPGLA
jgi:hypothetical protein